MNNSNEQLLQKGWLRDIPERIVDARTRLVANSESDIIRQLKDNGRWSIERIDTLPGGRFIADMVLYKYLKLEFDLIGYTSEEELAQGIDYYAGFGWIPVGEKFFGKEMCYQKIVKVSYDIP